MPTIRRRMRFSPLIRCLLHSMSSKGKRLQTFVAIIGLTSTLLAVSPGSSKADVLTANVANFSVSPIGSSGTVTGIDSTAGVQNYVELEIPALSILTINVSVSGGGSLTYIDSRSNTGYDVPTGT